jgi:hypothetical protein
LGINTIAYNYQTDILNNIKFRLYVPDSLKISPNDNIATGDFSCYSKDEVIMECNISKKYTQNNKLIFNVNKLPVNYDINKPETHPEVTGQISSVEPDFEDTNPANDTAIISVRPL